MRAATEDAPDSGRLDPSIWKIGAVAVVGSFLAQLDATVVNVSLSGLAASLNASLSAIQWVTSGYLLALALMLPLSGWLVDRVGAKALYLGCFFSFTVSSALCGLAWSADSLIGFRILQGMSAGPLAPMAQMMMARAAGRRMASVFGFAAMPILLAPLLGPVLAGAILQFASWRWLFLINLPVGVLALVLAARLLPNDQREARPRELDLVGWALLSPALVLFLYGSDHIRERLGGMTLAGATLLFGAFFRWAMKNKDEALIDLRLFKGKPFSASALTQFMANGISYAGQMLIPVFLIRVGDRSPSATGLLLAPLGLGMMCGYPFVGTWVKWFGNRTVSVAGASLTLLGTLPFAYMAEQGVGVMLLTATLFIRGVSMSAVSVPSVAAAYSSVTREDLPMATTTLNIVMRIGGPTLTTICASFLGWRLESAPGHDGISSAFAAAFALLCGFHGLLIAATLRLPDRALEPSP
jgi:EmrB/QacA subfamily drug resistance transporter